MSSKAARGKTAAAKSAAASAAGVHDPKKMKHNQSGRYNDRRRPNVYDTYEEYSKAEIECPGCKQDPPRTREKKGGGKYKWCCYSCSKIRKNPYLKNWKPQAGRVSSKAGRKRKVKPNVEAEWEEYECEFCDYDGTNLAEVEAHEERCHKNPRNAINGRGSRTASRFKKVKEAPAPTAKDALASTAATVAAGSSLSAASSAKRKGANGTTSGRVDKSTTAGATNATTLPTSLYISSTSSTLAAAATTTGTARSSAAAAAATAAMLKKKKTKKVSASEKKYASAKGSARVPSGTRRNLKRQAVPPKASSSNASRRGLGSGSAGEGAGAGAGAGAASSRGAGGLLSVYTYIDGSSMHVGDKVDAYCNENGLFYPGTIALIGREDNGCLSINYTDGGVESSIPAGSIKKHFETGSVENSPFRPSYTKTPTATNALERDEIADMLSTSVVPHKLTRTVGSSTDTLYCRSARKVLEFLQIKHSDEMEQNIVRDRPIKGWQVARCSHAEFLAIA